MCCWCYGQLVWTQHIHITTHPYILYEGLTRLWLGWLMNDRFGEGKRGLVMGIWNSHTSIGNILGNQIGGLGMLLMLYLPLSCFSLYLSRDIV
jgi:hypothetical protein